MRRLVYALSLSTLFFAVCTAYLARELYLERARTGAAPARASSTVRASKNDSADPSATSPQVAAAPAAASTQSAVSTASASANSSTPAAAATQSRKHATTTTVVSQASPDLQKVLAQLEDPVQRAAMVEERKNMYRTMFSGLGDYLHMDDGQLERLFGLKAQHELALQEVGTRCYIENNCAGGGRDRGLMKAQKQEMVDQFGAQTMEAFELYQRTMSERRTVSDLRGRLPDKYRLLDSQSDALVGAFHEERQRVQRDMQQRGIEVSNFNNVIYAPTPGTPRDDKSAQAAEEYNRMLRDRAATVLTPEQLAAFEKMQQEALGHFRSMESHSLRMNASSQEN
jgi:hypothetical protein